MTFWFALRLRFMTAFNFEATASPPASSAGVTIFDPLERRPNCVVNALVSVQVHGRCSGHSIGVDN